MSEKKKAIVLLSGGIDSSTTLAVAIHENFEPYVMSIDYGQRHKCELKAARLIAESMNVKHSIVVTIDLRMIGGSALTADIEVPKSRTGSEISAEIPVTYVPARNTIFLSYALGWAEVLGAPDIFIGVNAIDYSGYPDCRPEFISAYESMANLATKQGVEGRRFTIQTPLINLTKSGIITKGHELGIDFSLTHSCYDPEKQGRSCGRCDSCRLRLKGFAEAGLEDPIEYKT